jgi:hypothetical protein
LDVLVNKITKNEILPMLKFWSIPRRGLLLNSSSNTMKWSPTELEIVRTNSHYTLRFETTLQNLNEVVLRPLP